MGRKRHLNESAKHNSSTSPIKNDLQKGFVNKDKKDTRWSFSPLHIPVIPTVVDEQTPTPTRLLRSCDEVGLFSEISKSAYGEDFKQQNMPDELNSVMTTLPSQQNAPIPSVILESTADDNEAEDEISVNALQDTGSSTFFVSDATSAGCQLMYNMPQEADTPAEAALVEHSAERPHVQVLLQLPNGGLIPINIPADALAHATIPVMTSPAVAVASSVTQPIAPMISAPNVSRGITSSTKQKLKAAVQQSIQQNHQQQHQQQPVSLSKPPVVGAVQPVSSPTVAHQTLLKNSKTPLTPVSQYIAVAPPSGINASSQSSGRSSDDEEEGKGKRKKFLESNRAAANRCRQRKKQRINSLEDKTKRLQEVNNNLVAETTQLRREIAQLKQALAAHKDCPPSIAFMPQNI